MDTQEKQLISDLTKHLREKIAQNIDDVMDTATIAGLETVDKAVIVLRNLIGLAAGISYNLGSDKHTFMLTCGDIYDIINQEKKHG